MDGRDTPPSVQDGKNGWEPSAIDNFAFDKDGEPKLLTPGEGMKLARASYEASTNWINASRRAAWSDNLRAFNSEHPMGSKYASNDYRYRSSLYRPKTRASVRKSEAHTATAFFSNQDVVSIQANDDDDPKQQASAAFMQELLQYRLTKTIPWFLTIVGARQDTEVMGVCIGKGDWEYEEKVVGTKLQPKIDPATGELAIGDDGFAQVEEVDIIDVVKDRPTVDLIAPENFRFEPGCDWRDPVNSSPYLIELMPIYIQEVEARIASGEWFSVSNSALRGAADISDDPTRRARERGRVPGKDGDAWKPQAFDICWVHNNIMRYGGEEWQYYTLGGGGELLSNPRPMKEVYLHGVRPYVLGFVVLETHKTYPSGKPELTRDLQRAANDDWNLRFDVLKLQLNPRQFIKTGAGVDITDARTFMPGKVILTKDPQTDIQWDRPPSPGAEAYQEADRINLDWDDLVGDFTNASVQSSQLEQQSATGMNLMSGEASGTKEYELRMFAETFVEPLLRLLIKLEQAYETDETVLAIAGRNAQLIQRFGIDHTTDDLLSAELTATANVGIGATNPQLKLKNFSTGADILGKMYGAPTVAMGSNFEEVSKEVFGLLGYKDGERFFKPGFDPRVAMLQQQLKQAQAKDPQQAPPDTTKIQAAQVTGQYKLQEQQAQALIDRQQQESDLAIAQINAQAEVDRQKVAQAHEVAMENIRAQHEAFHQARAPQPVAAMA